MLFCNFIYLTSILITTTLLHVFESNAEIPAWERNFDFVKPSTPSHVQQTAVTDLIGRLLPKHRDKFYIEVDASFNNDKKDVFRIKSPLSATDSRVGIKGTSGVAAAWGLLHYLKYYCNAHVSWEADQLDLPSPLPKAYVKIAALDRFRYYQNVCTVSYSFAWWGWKRWERHIDWMALNGINFPLAFTAQEAIWRRVYLRFNFTEQDLDEHFVGPAYLAWGRMGNIQEWKGPLSANWHSKTLALQHRILKRMRSLGMMPILPAFAGHVPSAIKRVFPEAQVTRLTNWGKFKNDNYTRTYLLDPREKLFSEIGSAFIKEMEQEFNGTDHFYNCDTFNEMTPTNSSTEYLRSVGKSIFKAMTIADKKAVWVMQGWLFRDVSFWTYSAAKALLTSVPQGRMIVLDLTTDVEPVYPRLKSFFGQPFIFCMLHNYGGVNGFFGNIDVLLQHMKDARSYPNVTLVGTGLTPEGINQNYVMYDVMLELAWRKPDLNVTQWALNYAKRRYGCNSEYLEEAWAILMKTVYNCQTHMRFHGLYILIQHRPDFKRQSHLWYKIPDLLRVWDLFIFSVNQTSCQMTSELENSNREIISTVENSVHQSRQFWERGPLMKDKKKAKRSADVLKYHNEVDEEFGKTSQIFPLQHRETFLHDLVDVSRQVMQVLGEKVIEEMRIAYLLNSSHDLNRTSSILLELFDDLDLLLGTSNSFLLGDWLRDAESWASTKEEKSLYKSNARYQITLWGPNGEILDYAVKQWNGVVRDYMKPRWALFIEKLNECLADDKKFIQKDFDREVFSKVEKYFADGSGGQIYAETEKGNVTEIALKLYSKYRPMFHTTTANSDIINM